MPAHYAKLQHVHIVPYIPLKQTSANTDMWRAARHTCIAQAHCAKGRAQATLQRSNLHCKAAPHLVVCPSFVAVLVLAQRGTRLGGAGVRCVPCCLACVAVVCLHDSANLALWLLIDRHDVPVLELIRMPVMHSVCASAD